MTDAIFIVRRMQEKYREKDKKLYMCFVNLKKVFDGVPTKIMQWALRRKGLPEILVKAVVSLYEVSKIKVGFEFSEELYVAVCIHQGFVLSALFAIVVHIVTKNAREGLCRCFGTKQRRI